MTLLVNTFLILVLFSLYDTLLRSNIPETFCIRKQQAIWPVKNILVNKLTLMLFLSQAAQARCINYREFCVAYYKRFKDFVWEIQFFFQASSFQLLKLENLLWWSFFTFKFNTVVKTSQRKRWNIGTSIEINCTYVKLGLLLLFLCNLGWIHGLFIRFCGSLFVRCCFPT